MKKILAGLIVLALFAGVGLLLHAQDRDADPVRGKVLLLKTGHAMEGDIEKIRGQFCVRRGKSEVWIAEDLTIRLCIDWNDAFAFAQAKIDPNSANDRVRLARWCHLHRLSEKALEQARIALQLQSSNSDAIQLVKVLERTLSEPAPKPAAPPPVVARPIEATPTVDVTFDTQVAFATKVQPILMNKCATCHANGAGGKFHLDRVTDNGQKAGTQRNLAAVLSYIDLKRPAISPLLVKAVTPHGDGASPIRDRSEKTLQAMHLWIEQTIARNPQLKDIEDAKKSTPARPTPEPKSVFPTQKFAVPAQGEDVVSKPAPRVEIDERNPPRVQPVETPRPPMTVTPSDEFDALHFNMWAHPQFFRQQSASRAP